MKKTTYSNEELLILLASKGDAAAFYSIAAPYFEVEYLNLRHNGSTHNDAVEKILPDTSELFRKILGTRPDDFGDWFKNNSEISSNDSEEIALFSAEKNLSVERNHFLRELQLHLLRTASDFNNKKRKKILLMLRNPKTKLILIAITFLTVITAAFIFLFTTTSSVSISFKTSEKEYNFNIGSRPKETTPDSSLIVSAQKPDSASIDSVKDTLIPTKIEEKIPVLPPVRKVTRPKVVPVEAPRISQAPPAVVPPEPSPSTYEGSAAAASTPSVQSTPVESSTDQPEY